MKNIVRLSMSFLFVFCLLSTAGTAEAASQTEWPSWIDYQDIEAGIAPALYERPHSGRIRSLDDYMGYDYPRPYNPLLLSQVVNNPRQHELMTYWPTEREMRGIPERFVVTGGNLERMASPGYWPTWIGEPVAY